MSTPPTEIRGEVTISDGCVQVENCECCPLNVEGCVNVENCECCPLHVNVGNTVDVKGVVGITGCVGTCVKNKVLCAITEETLDKGLARTFCATIPPSTNIPFLTGTITLTMDDAFYVKSLLFVIESTALGWNAIYELKVKGATALSGTLLTWPGTISNIAPYYRFELDLDEVYGCNRLNENWHPLIYGDTIELTTDEVLISFCVHGCVRCPQRECMFSVLPPVGENFETNICSCDEFTKDVSELVTVPNDDMCNPMDTSRDNLLYAWSVDDECGTITGASAQPTPSENSIIMDTLKQGDTGATGPCKVTYTVTAYNNGCSSEPFLVCVNVYPEIFINISGQTAYCCESEYCDCDSGDDEDAGRVILNASVQTSEPVTYQWKFNGVPLQGKTSAILDAEFDVFGGCGVTGTVCVCVEGQISGCTAMECIDIEIAPELTLDIKQIGCFTEEKEYLEGKLTICATGGFGEPYMYEYYYSPSGCTSNCDAYTLVAGPTTDPCYMITEPGMTGCYRGVVRDSHACCQSLDEVVPFEC